MDRRLNRQGWRAERTERAIVEALVTLLGERRYESIQVSDLIRSAGVGRSTFYEHFGTKDDVLVFAMRPVLTALATAASGRAARSHVRAMVEHLWARRSTARLLLASSGAKAVHRQLTAMIEENIQSYGFAAPSPHLTAIGVASAQLAMLRCWLEGRAQLSVRDMADRLMVCSTLAGSFLPPAPGAPTRV